MLAFTTDCGHSVWDAYRRFIWIPQIVVFFLNAMQVFLSRSCPGVRQELVQDLKTAMAFDHGSGGVGLDLAATGTTQVDYIGTIALWQYSAPLINSGGPADLGWCPRIRGGCHSQHLAIRARAEGRARDDWFSTGRHHALGGSLPNRCKRGQLRMHT